jgi:hypothetical protein
VKSGMMIEGHRRLYLSFDNSDNYVEQSARERTAKQRLIRVSCKTVMQLSIIIGYA